MGQGRSQDQLYQYSSFGRGGAKGKRGGTALFAMSDDQMEQSSSETEATTATITGEGNTAWVDTDYQVTNKWDEPIDVNKNPLFKALKLGISVFKD